MSVIVIGAGLAGLATAFRLSQAGVDVQVLEASAFAGGRIQPAFTDGHQDLGPTWVWPYAQPVITRWLEDLQLELFDQYDKGAALIDRDLTTSAQRHGLAFQYGSARIKGGTYSLINALLDKLNGIVRVEHVVNSCTLKNKRWQLNVSTTPTELNALCFTSSQIVVATPPRLAAKMLSHDHGAQSDELEQAIQILNATQTWMAPHTKVVVEYETAFWREQDLSGRIASQVGPLVEVHDHSGPDGTPAALFGFAGASSHSHNNNNEQFKTAVKQQLQRCFGEIAPDPLNIIVKDWAFEPYTTTAADRNGEGSHPKVLSKIVRKSHCENTIWFAVSETSERSPGLIEGALSRADKVADEIVNAT